MRDASATTRSKPSKHTRKLAEVLGRATEIFGDRQAAENWLVTPAIGLDQRCPADLLTTPAGIKQVEELLVRMNYGVYV